MITPSRSMETFNKERLVGNRQASEEIIRSKAENMNSQAPLIHLLETANVNSGSKSILKNSLSILNQRDDAKSSKFAPANV